MRLPLTVAISTAGKMIVFPSVLFFLFLFTPKNSEAQNRWSVDVNASVFLPAGRDATEVYYSTQPIAIEYFTRKKFDHQYVAILPNINYAVTSTIIIGVQSGVYAHFNERFAGYRMPVFVAIPLLGTGRFNLTRFLNNQLGVSVSAGRNFFAMETFPYEVKNGWLYNGSIFFARHNSIVKLGLEEQHDHGYIHHVSSNQYIKDETIKRNMRRRAVTVSYGLQFSL